MRRQDYTIFAYANAGVFCDGYILSSIGLALVTLAPRFGLNAVTAGSIGAGTLFGILVGAPLFGHLTDRHGRRILMIADLGAFVVIAIAQIFVTAAWQLIALRFLLGVAIGADYPIATAIIAEFMPAARRGAALCAMEGVWSLGAAVAYIAGYALLQTGAQSWKWILASPAIFAVIGLLLRTSAPESPMWLAARDAGELRRVSFGTLFHSAYRGKLAFISAMWLLQVVPLFAIYTYAPAVLAALGLGSNGSPAGSIAITMALRWARSARCRWSSVGAGDPSASADSRSRCWLSASCRLREPRSWSSHSSPTRSAWVRRRYSNSSIRPSFSPPRSARREPGSQQA